MRMHRSCLLACGLLLALGGGSLLPAAEPAREFLEKLRERGYFDTALEYLDVIAKSPNVPAAMKETLDYEKGTTLVDASRATRDAAIRAKQLDEAQTLLTRFMTERAKHALAPNAQRQIGNLMVERARIIRDAAKKKNNDPAEMKKALALYQEAHKNFDATQNAIGEELKKIPPKLPDNEEKLKEKQEQLRIDYLQTQLLSAAIREEMADAMDPKSKEFKETLLAAAKEYGEIYDKYRTRLAGLYARLYQGRCHHKLGDDKEALSFYTELLEEQDNSDEVRTLKTKTLTLAIESWSSASQKKHADAIAKGTAWLQTVRPVESKSDDWLEFRMALAKAMKAYSDNLKASDAKQSAGQLNEARKLVLFVSKIPGEHQKEAKNLLAEWGAGDAGKVASGIEPKSFTEAFEAGKEALDAMRVQQQVLSTLPPRLKVEKDAKVLDDIKKQIEDAQATMPKFQEEAQRLFHASLALIKPDTENDQINLVEYYLCYLAYLKGDYYNAALIGQFVAERYPDSPGARQCAKIAMAAYVRLFADLQKEEKAKTPPTSDAEILKMAEFESDSVVKICEYITKKWPEHPEAEEALNTLIPFMISTGQLAKAEAYLQKIPADSANRGNAELKTGQAMWSEYVRGMAQIAAWDKEGMVPEGVDLGAKKKDLTALKTRAQKTLEDGVNRMKKNGTPSAIFASAMLSLAQIYVDTDQTAKAITELEDPKVGPLTLVSKKDASVDRPGFAEETLKVALRAYIGALPSADNKQATELLKKAKLLMEELKKQVGTDAGSQEKLVKIYIGIAQDLKSQMELAETPAARTALAKGFETFLGQVGAEATEFNVLNWVAETYFQMGEAFLAKTKGSLPPEAKTYYQKALDQFNAIIEKGKKQKDFYDPKLGIALQMRTASCKRRLGDCDGAIKDLEAILKANPMMVNVQMEAARTYQECGLSQGDSKLFFRAIMGGENKNEKKEPYIWGWGLISRKTANNAAFKDIFYEARLQLAYCRFRMGKLEKNAAKAKELMEGAEKDIRNVSVVDKEYGGEKWRPEFDKLCKEIQKELKQKQDGLKAFDVQIKPVANK
jgi:tetratricopeptide (TPR) repeat protein